MARDFHIIIKHAIWEKAYAEYKHRESMARYERSEEFQADSPDERCRRYAGSVAWRDAQFERVDLETGDELAAQVDAQYDRMWTPVEEDEQQAA